jgi:exoribonuclease R
MQGIVELHGAKLVVNVEGTSLPLYSTSFMPGDQVEMNSTGTWSLARREPHTTVAVKRPNGTLYFPTLGPACPFTLKCFNYSIANGARLVIRFDETGKYTIEQTFGPGPDQDATAIIAAYRQTPKRPPLPVKQGAHYYTRDEIVNHNDLNTFTIDPATSQDFDDAISVDLAEGVVYVHIVDAASIDVSSIEQKIRERCVTLYLANDQTEHLLDEEDACYKYSLIEGQERQVITVKVKLHYGEVETFEIYRSTIIVKTRWNYEEVKNVLENACAPPEIKMLADWSNMRSCDMQYNLALPSVRPLVGKDGKPNKIIHDTTNDLAHSVVSTPMILANMIVSKHLHSCGVRIPNRFHDVLRGIPHGHNAFPSTGHPHVDSFLLIKRYAKALYSCDQWGHFGLRLQEYVHFTSPMRRYADIITHRLLAGYHYDDDALDEEVAYLNRRVALCRALQDLYSGWKIAQWYSAHPDNYTVYVTDVKQVGVMWYMPTLSLNGFTHVRQIKPSQYYTFDMRTQSLVGGNDGIRISLGQPMTSVLIEIDAITFIPQLELHALTNTL